MFAIITFPEGFLSDITGTMGTIITDLSGFLSLIVGVLLGTLVLTILIHAIGGHK